MIAAWSPTSSASSMLAERIALMSVRWRSLAASRAAMAASKVWNTLSVSRFCSVARSPAAKAVTIMRKAVSAWSRNFGGSKWVSRLTICISRSPSGERGSGTARPASGGKAWPSMIGPIVEAGHLAGRDRRLLEADAFAQHAAQAQHQEQRDAGENDQRDREIAKTLKYIWLQSDPLTG